MLVMHDRRLCAPRKGIWWRLLEIAPHGLLPDCLPLPLSRARGRRRRTGWTDSPQVWSVAFTDAGRSQPAVPPHLHCSPLSTTIRHTAKPSAPVVTLVCKSSSPLCHNHIVALSSQVPRHSQHHYGRYCNIIIIILTLWLSSTPWGFPELSLSRLACWQLLSSCWSRCILLLLLLASQHHSRAASGGGSSTAYIF